MQELNKEAIQKAAHASTTAEIVAEMLSKRERQRGSVNIPRTHMQLMYEGNVINDEDYNRFWLELEKAGVGRIINGRNKKPSEFRFDYNLIEVGKIAVKNNKNPNILLRKAPQNLIKVEDSSKVLEQSTDKVIEADTFIYIPLRDDYRVSIKVPRNLTKEESKIIAESLRRVTC